MEYKREDVLLSVKGVSKSFDKKPVLNNVSFDVHNVTRPGKTQGQIVSIIGKSGCGKSTLFNIMAGLLKPNTGEVRVRRAFDDFGYVKEGDMGIVYQNAWVYPWRTVRGILTKAAEKNPAKWKSNEISEYVENLSKYSSQLSGGQRQRVAIAEQILNGGDFILLDEPFSGLDTLTIDKVTNILVTLSQSCEFKTLVLVSHDLSNACAISDTVFILSKPSEEEGATIKSTICLAEMGLAWRSDIKDDTAFRSLLKHIKGIL
jgi:ABC-type nitrate/sulfonate/bicarbonate transport system ATPase subunit